LTAANEQILREQFAAAEDRATWPRAMELWDETVVLLVGERVGVSEGLVVGREAVGRWFAEWLSAFDDISFEIRAIEQGGDALAAHARHSARGRESGIEVATDIYYAYWFRAGKVIRSELHSDRATAWRAAGVTA
jgi:ketosteroid isomerase-like protein